MAAQLGYAGPNAVGSSLRSGRVGAVGVVVMDSVADALEDPSTIPGFLTVPAPAPSGRRGLLLRPPQP